MNRKAETFFDAITLLREDLVEEAQNYVFRRKRSGWRNFGSLAACVALVISLGIVAVLPKGCGAGGSDMSGGALPSTSDNSSPSPADAPPSSEEPPYGSWNPADGAPQPPVGSTEPEQGEPSAEISFHGQVVQILADGLLVEPFDEFLADDGLIHVPTEELEELPEFYQGAHVHVFCGAVMFGEAEDVTAVWLLEP